MAEDFAFIENEAIADGLARSLAKLRSDCSLLGQTVEVSPDGKNFIVKDGVSPVRIWTWKQVLLRTAF